MFIRNSADLGSLLLNAVTPVPKNLILSGDGDRVTRPGDGDRRVGDCRPGDDALTPFIRNIDVLLADWGIAFVGDGDDM